jgi:hypothetical protein
MATSSKRNAPKLSRIVTLGEIESELINNIIQLIYEIKNMEDELAKLKKKKPSKK